MTDTLRISHLGVVPVVAHHSCPHTQEEQAVARVDLGDMEDPQDFSWIAVAVDGSWIDITHCPWCGEHVAEAGS